MAKKKKSKVVQMLSPENYIRQKAHTLPMHECWINSDWEESKQSSIIIARKHTNGNYTIGIYLVDLFCLGVKDTHFEFNIAEPRYLEIVEKYDGGAELEKVDYLLVHNIILAAVEFADDYGFKPHKNYNALTRYILEEDTDEIELMEIDCGENNEPVYFRGMHDTDADAARIIAQLEKTAGKGNYKVIDPTKDNSNLLDEDELLDNLFDDAEEVSVDEQLEEFNKQFASFEDMDDFEREEFFDLADSIILATTDIKDVGNAVDSFLHLLDNIEITEELPDEMLGINNTTEKGVNELRSEFINIIDWIELDKKKAKRKIERLKKWLPLNAAVQFLELEYLTSDNIENVIPKIDSCANDFPNNLLIKLKKFEFEIFNNDVKVEATLLADSLLLLIENRKVISQFEISKLLLLLVLNAVKFNDIVQIEALYVIIDEVDIDELQFEMINSFIHMSRIEYLISTISEPQPGMVSNQQSSLAYQFKIQIKNINKPLVWRRIKVPAHFSFQEFHIAIQIAFGWENCHLFLFSPKGFGSEPLIELPHDDNINDGIDTKNAYELKLSEIFHSEKQKYTYIYDFGDDWEHSIVLEKIETETIMYPILMDGKSKCPPEDCGGYNGYLNLKENLADPNNSDDSDFREWLGMESDEVWDASEFNLKLVQMELISRFGSN